MKYAVVNLKGHQYRVQEGEELLVDYLGGEKPDPDVLLVAENGKSNVGTPKVKGGKVKIKVLEEEVKGEKLTVRKFKAKSRYRRKKGFRPKLSLIKIEKISTK